LKTSPGGGPYLCGRNVTEADFLVIFPIQACKQWASLTPAKFPKVCAYLDLMESRDSYKEAERRIIEIEGSFKPVF
jgi:glutathione S-transferase